MIHGIRSDKFKYGESTDHISNVVLPHLIGKNATGINGYNREMLDANPHLIQKNVYLYALKFVSDKTLSLGDMDNAMTRLNDYIKTRLEHVLKFPNVDAGDKEVLRDFLNPTYMRTVIASIDETQRVHVSKPSTSTSAQGQGQGWLEVGKNQKKQQYDEQQRILIVQKKQAEARTQAQVYAPHARATCTMHMHHAPCAMHHAPCTMRHAPCAMHHAPCTMRAATCDMHHMCVAG
jgi:hypothetical protein